MKVNTVDSVPQSLMIVTNRRSCFNLIKRYFKHVQVKEFH